MTHTSLPLFITTGEPAGIGMDIVLDRLVNFQTDNTLIIGADKDAFYERSLLLQRVGKISTLPKFDVLTLDELPSTDLSALPSRHTLLHIPCADKVVAGVANPKNAPMVERQLAVATDLAMSERVSAIVTAPLAKSVMIDGGVCLDDGTLFSGHTEYFMQKAKCEKVVMMLANHTMKVALVTTHLPLKDVPNAITPQEIRRTVQITHDYFVQKMHISRPKILVCGLNPHAGEGGHLGTEEETIINPVLRSFQESGMDISLALPADTLFTPKYLQNADVVIAMYHDQGLTPLKSHGFGDTVNITLGLPFIRTSVDHGTALDLAGTGKADSSSLGCALQMAASFV